MKKLLILALLAFGMNANAQIEEIKKTEYTLIGEVKYAGTFLFELTYSKYENDINFYFISYRNAAFKTLTETEVIAFSGTEDDLNNLYTIMENLLINGKHQDSKSLKIGKHDVSLMKSDNFGLMVYLSKYNYFYISDKQLKKLFNKQ